MRRADRHSGRGGPSYQVTPITPAAPKTDRVFSYKGSPGLGNKSHVATTEFIPVGKPDRLGKVRLGMVRLAGVTRYRKTNDAQRRKRENNGFVPTRNLRLVAPT